LLAANQKLKLELMKSKDENHLNSLVSSLQKTNEDLINKLELKEQLMQTNQHMIETLKQKAYYKKKDYDSPQFSGRINSKE